MSVQRPPAWARTGPLPSLSNLKSLSGDANQSLTHVSERGGPWDSAALDPTFHLSLQTTLPMTMVYFKDPQLGWLPYLLVAESTLLRRAGAPSGLGVFALKRFRGPREAGANDGDEIGCYGGDVVATAPTQLEAKERAQTLVRRGHQSLLTMRMRGHSGWLVVDGDQHSVLPFLNRVNDPRNTPFAPRCTVSDFGIFRAARDIPPLDWTRPLSEQAASELSIDYGKEYWETHDLLGSKALPLEVGGIRTMRLDLANLEINAPASKRKTTSSGHFGQRADSAYTSVRLIALSRVLLTKDTAVLMTVARSAHGAELLRQLETTTFRLAKQATGGNTALNLGNITTMFNITGSTLANQGSYEALFGLPDKISWNDSRAVYNSLLDALAYARATPAGAAVESLIMSNTSEPDASPAAVISAFVAAVEERAAHRLTTAPRLGASSYSSSLATSSTLPTPPSAPSPVPATAVPPSPLPPSADFRIDPTTSLASNLMRLIEGRIHESAQNDRSAIRAALDEGMSLLAPAHTSARRQELMATNILTAITHPGIAWLWASTLEVASNAQVSKVDDLTIRIVNSCSATAGSLFAEDALLGF